MDDDDDVCVWGERGSLGGARHRIDVSLCLFLPHLERCPPSPESSPSFSHKQDESSQCVPTPSLPRLTTMTSSHPTVPAFLEPEPQLDNHRMSHYESAFRPLLFKEKWKCLTDKLPSLQIPIPRRSSMHHHARQQRHQVTRHSNNNEHVSSSTLSNKGVSTTAMVEDEYSPMSPTMATASAAAAAAAVQHHPGSTVAESFLNCLRLSSLRHSTPPPCSLSSSSSTNSSSSDDEALLDEQDPAIRMAAEALAAASADAHHRAAQENHHQQLVSLAMQQQQQSNNTAATNTNKRSSGIDQSKFLTKNAHIKRPRNAWIHVSLFLLH